VDLTDSVVVVTGAGGGGCGRAISQRFAREGAIVVVSDIDAAGGRETVRLIEVGGGRAVCCAADVRVKDQVANLIDTAMRVGDFRVLINNASGVFDLDDPLEMWQELVEIDLLGTMYGTRLAIDAFRKRGMPGEKRDGCSIVNMSSITGLWHGREHASPGYDAVKAGVIRLTTMLASLNESDGIRVNCLAPGWIAAPQVREYWEPLTAEERKARHAPSRLLALDEVADAVFRLATDESLYGRVMLWWSEDEPRLIPWGDRGYESSE
jgi:NAD(P)-dependent dehydrogenase (short-subunit alcohol dehydrogenase family)